MLKICLIVASPREKKGNTYEVCNKILEEFKKYDDVEVTEFFPKDFPKQCTGCYTCINIDEKKCPHRIKVGPIEDAMMEADGIIFATPVYVMNMSGHMKTLLDHFGYMFAVHRPRTQMYKKAGMIVSTTAGTGTKQAINSIAESIKYWGIMNPQKVGIALRAESYEAMPDKKVARLDKMIKKQTKQFYQEIKKRHKGKTPFLHLLMRKIMKPIISKNDKNSADYKYWTNQGWL